MPLHIILTFSLLVSLFFCFPYWHDPQVLIKSYLVNTIILLGGLLFICFQYKKKKVISIDYISLSLVTLFSYILLHLLFSANYIEIIYLISYITLYFIIKNSISIHYNYINVILLLCIFTHSVYGIIQYLVFNKVNYITGTFDNPAGFAVCIISGIPFCVEALKSFKTNMYVKYSILGIITFSLILSGSRAGIISFFSMLIFYCLINYYPLINKYIKSISIVLFIIICPLFIFIFYLKHDSAIGRLLIWSNSINMIKDKPFFGFGSDGFAANYMLYQAKKFEMHNDSPFSILADNVYHPFNEYIKLTVDYGILGLFLLIIVYIFMINDLSKKKLAPYLMSIIGISVFALFSYPFRYSFVAITTIYCLAIIAKQSLIKFRTTISSYFYLAFSFILLSSSYICIKEIYLEAKWKELSKRVLVSSDPIALEKYDQLYNNWASNPLFLYNYGAILNYKGEYKKSILILDECTSKFNDYDVQILLGENYFKMREWQKAKNHYQLASQMCPVRFIPLYYLSQIYDSINQPDNAIRYAEIILEKPIKIPSLTIKQIKIEMKQKIQNH